MATAAVAAMASALGWTAPALAQELGEARQAYFEARFHEATEQLEALLGHPGLTAEEALEAHRYLAALRHALGAPAVAMRHAEAAVALDPAVAPAEGSPPEVGEMMEAARRAQDGQRAELALEVEPSAGDAPRTVRARLSPAPEALIAQIELRCSAGAEPPVSERGPPPAVQLDLPAADAARHCTAEARTAGGATLFRSRETVPADRLPAVTVPPAPASEQGHVVGDEQGGSSWPWLVAAGTALAVAAGVVLFLLFASDGQDAPSLDRTTVAGWE